MRKISLFFLLAVLLATVSAAAMPPVDVEPWEMAPGMAEMGPGDQGAHAGSRHMTPGWILWDARSTRRISNCKSSALNGIRRSSTCFWRRTNNDLR